MMKIENKMILNRRRQNIYPIRAQSSNDKRPIFSSGKKQVETVDKKVRNNDNVHAKYDFKSMQDKQDKIEDVSFVTSEEAMKVFKEANTQYKTISSRIEYAAFRGVDYEMFVKYGAVVESLMILWGDRKKKKH